MSEWDTTEFGSLYAVPSKNGLMAPSRVRGAGALLVNMKEIFAYDIISDQGMERAPLPQRAPESWLLREGDLLFARQSLTLAGAGKVSLVVAPAEPMTFESHIIRVRLDPGVADSRYYYYLFRSALGRELMATIVEQVAAAGIRASDLARLTVPKPPLDEQCRIAAVLGALDDLAAANRALVLRLEALGSALLAAELESIDPAAHGVLGDYLAVLETGRRPRGGATSSGVVSLGAESVFSAGIDATGAFKFVPADFAAQLSRGHLSDGDVLVYKDGAALASGSSIVTAFGFGFPVDKAVVNEHVYRLRGAPGVSQGVLYWLLRSDVVDAEVRSRVTGAAQPGLNSASLRAVRVPDPVALSRRVGGVLDLLLAQMLTLGAEIRNLAETRDALLPPLISGAIHVRNGMEAA